MECKGPFASTWNDAKLYLLVDAIQKDPENRKGYELTIESN